MKVNKFLIFGFFILSVLATLGYYEYSLLDKANNQAEKFRHTLSRREFLLNRIDQSIGYNGAIHHFKNYILRGKPGSDKYYAKAQNKILKGLEAIDTLSLEFKEYSEYVPPIRQVFLLYLEKLDQAKELISKKNTPSVIDGLVTVNDAPAISALEKIEEHFILQKKVFRANHERNVQSLKKTFVITFTVAAVLFAGLLFAYSQALSSVVSQKLKFSESKDSFVRKMAHEIRTPLNAMLGFQEFLHLETMREDDRENLIHIKESSIYLLTLINDILDFSKLKERKLELEPEPVNETDFWQSIKMVGLGLKKSEQDFEVILPEKKTWICVDEIRLRQILLNLLSNSFKFTPEKGKISLKLEFKESTSSMKITVSDTGSGMSKEALENIFSEFYQVKGQTQGSKGTGLGLNITKTLVELMGGTIEVHSVLGEGSTFVVTLPRRIESQESIATLEEASGRKAVQSKVDFDVTGLLEQKVLVVEDTPINQKLMLKFYNKLGLPPPLIAEDGLQALKMIAEHKPDLIFMDLLMPNLGGIETTIKIREDFPYDPIIIGLSANVESEKECLEAGMNDFLPKPLQRKALKQVLDNYRIQPSKKSA